MQTFVNDSGVFPNLHPMSAHLSPTNTAGVSPLWRWPLLQMAPAPVRLRRWIWKLAIATLLLMAVGSATRVMNAGLACPDWPLCYGQLVPSQQMNLRVFLEWFHRLDAMVIGLMAIALAAQAWWCRRDLPRWLPWATTGALALIVVQGGLGGLTVTQLLRFDIVTAPPGSGPGVLSHLARDGLGVNPLPGVRNGGQATVLGAVSQWPSLLAMSPGGVGRFPLGGAPMLGHL
jgi:cytochrome c oxidase assembly protein subunit 15